MNDTLILSLVAALIVSVLSMVGIIGLLFKRGILDRILIFLVSFAAGSLIGGAFFHILPEHLEDSDDILQSFVYLVIGFCLFFILERILRWHHCHKGECNTHIHLGWLNLLGDGVHNFIDGMVIFAAFAVGPFLGWPVLLSIIFHEIPQELGDFGVLVYSGFGRLKALAYNFISALLSFAGVMFAFIFYYYNLSIQDLLLPLAAGGFIYIAASDLVPELHQTQKISKSLINFVIFAAALILMWFLKIFFE